MTIRAPAIRLALFFALIVQDKGQTPRSDSLYIVRGSRLELPRPLSERCRVPLSLSPRSRTFLAAAGLVGIVFLAFARSLSGEFLWDDDLHITRNPTIIGPQGLHEIWTSAAANYFPLTLTNFWLQHATWGFHPLGYHAVTLLCHAIAALLLWRVLRQLAVPLPWLGALFWAVHPVQVESVAWICELKNTQSAIFFLLSVSAFLRAIAPPAGDPIQRRDYAMAFVWFLAALLSKPSTVMLPAVLALLWWWKRGRRAPGATLNWRDTLWLAPFFAVSLLAAGWTIWEQKFHSGAIGAAWDQTPAERLAIAGRSMWFYLGKLIWPAPLSFIYPRWQIDPRSLLSYAPAVGAVAGLWLLWRARSNGGRAILLSALVFSVLLFPIMGWFSVYFFRYSFVADHFQYLASMAPLALLGAFVGCCVPPRWRTGASALIVTALVAASSLHCRTFLSMESLWRSTLARNPVAAMAWLNLGQTYVDKGRHDDAIACFRRSLEIKSDDALAHNDLGCAYLLIGRPADALTHLQRAVALDPTNPEMHNNLGGAWRRHGRTEEALREYREALRLNPEYAEAYNNLGCELADIGKPAEAVPQFVESLRLRRNVASTHHNYGNALRALGRFPEALVQYEAALRLQHKFPTARHDYAVTLANMGRWNDVIAEEQRVLADEPDFALAHANLGTALATVGRGLEAWAQFETACRLSPDAAEVHNRYGSALLQHGQMDAALPHFAAAARLAPELAPARLNYGTALAMAQRWADAVQEFAGAVRLLPESADARANLAVARVNAGAIKEALADFEAALRLDPNAAKVHEDFGRVLEAVGRSEAAARELAIGERLRASGAAAH